MVVQAAESAGTLGEKHKTNLFVDNGKGVKNVCQVARSGYHGVESGSPSTSPGSLLEY